MLCVGTAQDDKYDSHVGPWEPECSLQTDAYPKYPSSNAALPEHW